MIMIWMTSVESVPQVPVGEEEATALLLLVDTERKEEVQFFLWCYFTFAMMGDYRLIIAIIIILCICPTVVVRHIDNFLFLLDNLLHWWRGWRFWLGLSQSNEASLRK